jgi:DNA-binding NtrC family response regulator
VCSPLAGAFAIHEKILGRGLRVSLDTSARIFVVDDEPVIASTLAAILQLHGFSARFFTSPLEALTAARTKAPELLISDVTMPDISGIDLAIKMKAQHPECKILLFSGHPASLALLEDARARAHDFRLLLKPVPPGEFLSEIGRTLAPAVPIPPHRHGTTLRPPVRFLRRIQTSLTK